MSDPVLTPEWEARIRTRAEVGMELDPEGDGTGQDYTVLLATIDKLRAAIYIEDCHVSGEHDPTHTGEYVCEIQLRDLAKRVVAALYGYDEDRIETAYRLHVEACRKNRDSNKGWQDSKTEIEYHRIRAEEEAKIPRKINRDGWYAYYKKDGTKQRWQDLDRWEAVKPIPEAR